MNERPRSGAFIVIEGGEGAGKGTVLAALAAALQARDFEVVATREPGGTPEGLALRALLLGAEGAVWDQWAELLLMTAARVQHVRRVIEPALERGAVVLSDRFVGSTIAYQGAGRGLPVAEIEALHRRAVGEVWPGLTVLLDIEPRLGLARSLARLAAQEIDEGRFEALSLAFHERVRQSFLEQAAARPAAHVVVDASPPLAEVVATVRDRVLHWLGERS